MSSPLRKPEGISWNAASVELPQIPMLPAGQDAMSSTISAVLPTLAAQLAANVAALSAKENTFTGKVGAAQAAYQNSDDAGSQSVGQIVGMLGQLSQQAGKMGQSAGAPAQALGGQTGMFGSLMQQAMQGAQGAGGQGAAGHAPGGQGAAGAPGGAALQGAGAPSQSRDDAVNSPVDQPAHASDQAQSVQDSERDDREALQRADDRADDRDMAAGPGEGRSGAGSVPVTPPEHGGTAGDEDLSRRM